jgi:ABC-type uncharacterized transport system permease subunit
LYLICIITRILVSETITTLLLDNYICYSDSNTLIFGDLFWTNFHPIDINGLSVGFQRGFFNLGHDGMLMEGPNTCCNSGNISYTLLLL